MYENGGKVRNGKRVQLGIVSLGLAKFIVGTCLPLEMRKKDGATGYTWRE
jgi:hypothetical protein